MKALALASAAACVLTCSGCATPTVSLARGPRAYTSDRYPDVLERWTRVGHAYTLQGFEDQIAATATFESWDFRWAYVARYANDFRLTTSERTSLLEASLAEADREHQFYVAIYTSNRRWGELTRRTSAWRVLLVDDHGNEVAPAAIEPVVRPGALERTYFPYTTPWRQVFRIRFPRRTQRPDGTSAEILNDATRYFILRFSGPLGHSDLVWSIVAGAEPS